MADKKTSEKYIAPPKYEFTDPKDIEGGCKCEENKDRSNWYKCAGDGCAKAGGACRLVEQAPGDPQLRLFTQKKDGDEKKPDDSDTFWQRAPGWQLFCVCLKYTGKEPTDDDKKKWPKLPKWDPPEGFKGVGRLCGSPVYAGGKWRCNGNDCYLVGIEKEGDTKLHKLGDPGHGVHEKDVKPYSGIFCIHLDP